MPVGRWLKDQFSFGNIAANLMWTAILAGLVRAASWLFGAEPRSELAYWLIVPPMLLALAFFARAVSGRTRLPDLVCHIEHITLGTGDYERPNDEKGTMAFVVFLVSIRNRGLPTVVSTYGLTVKHPSGQIFHAERISVRGEELRITPRGGTVQVLKAHDALDKRTIQPIPQGGIAQGFLLFGFPGIDLKLLEDPKAVIQLRCIDAWGRENRLERLFGPLKASTGLPNLPGITMTKGTSTNPERTH